MWIQIWSNWLAHGWQRRVRQLMCMVSADNGGRIWACGLWCACYKFQRWYILPPDLSIKTFAWCKSLVETTKAIVYLTLLLLCTKITDCKDLLMKSMGSDMRPSLQRAETESWNWQTGSKATESIEFWTLSFQPFMCRYSYGSHAHASLLFLWMRPACIADWGSQHHHYFTRGKC